ncbi:MAG: TolC family protein [Bacteroidota bacterium]
MRRLICWFLLSVNMSAGFSQAGKGLDQADIYSVLPLDTLIQRAVLNSPLLEVKDAQISAKEYDMEASRLEWTRNLALIGSGTYGSGSFLSNIQDGSVSAFQLTNRTSLNYAIGFSVRISPYDIFGTKRESRKKDYEILAVRKEKNIIIQEVRNEVIRLYSNLQLAQNLISVWIDQYQSADLACKLAEKYYQEGNTTTSEYTMALAKRNGALKELEIAKAEFWKSQKLLESIVGDSISE